MEKKTKILYLHTGAELYGADQILLSLVSNIDKKYFEPLVVLPNGGPLVNELKKNGIKTKIISYPIIRRKYFTPLGIINYMVQYKKSCKELLKLIEEENIKIVHNNTLAVLEGIALKKNCDVKLISHIHEMLDHPKFVVKILYKKHLKAADSVVCVSNAVKEHIETLVGKSKNLVVVHNGISPIKTENTNLKDKLNIPKNAKLFTIIGRINAIKGQNDFIEAIKLAHKENDNIYGLIVGDAFSGQEWRVEELKKELLNEGISSFIKYTGFTKNISEIYSITDTLILSSIQYDSFPTVVLEAMSCGIPTIAYRCGGVEEMIVNSKNGFLVEQGNITDLSNKAIIMNKTVMYDNCVKHFNANFSLNDFIKNFSKLYYNLSMSGDEK